MILRILLRQPFNYWRNINWSYRLQLLAVISVVGTYLVTRLMALFNTWIIEGPATASGLSAIIVVLYLSFSDVTVPFVLLYILPKQSALRFFLDKPLSKGNILGLLLVFTLKYQVVLLIITMPALLALTILSPGWGPMALFISVLSLLLIPLLNIVFMNFLAKPIAYLSLHFLGLAFFNLCFAWFYWKLRLSWIFITISITALAASFVFLYRQRELDFERFYFFGRIAGGSSVWKKTWLLRLPRFLPRKVQILFNKEIRSQWRNPRFLRHKLIILVTQIVFSILFLFQYKFTEEVIPYLLLLVGVLIWWHYGSYFSEKFAGRDLNWLINTTPMRFLSIFSAKLLAEFFYVLIILGILLTMMTMIHIHLYYLLQTMAFLLVFALVVVAVMINFQIMFYDNARYAGYAFHFSVLFFVIMSINYRFVGPFITLFMIGFLFYKNIRFFRS